MQPTTTFATPADYFNAALADVESASIRAWATSAHNHPLFLQLAEDAWQKNKTVEAMTISIVALAIGL